MSIRIGSWRRNGIVLGIFLLFYIGFGAFLTVFQESVVYQPFPQDFDNCPQMESAERIVYEGTRMYYRESGPALFVVYHGNAGSACDRAFLASLAEQAGYSYLVPEYTGYSNDTRSPSHEAVKRDIEHVVDFIGGRDFERIIVYGESIGTGAASYHASLAPPEGIVLIAPFTDLVAVARAHYWFYPVSLLVDNAFDNMRLLADYEGQLLAIHGDADEVIPIALGRELFDSLVTSERHFVPIAGAGHNTIYGSADLYDALRVFLR